MSEITRLAQLGIDAEHLSSAQRSVLATLSPAEVDVLAGVKRRLDAAEDVEGHDDGSGSQGGLWW
jgi:hypothetical protein